MQVANLCNDIEAASFLLSVSESFVRVTVFRDVRYDYFMSPIG